VIIKIKRLLKLICLRRVAKALDSGHLLQNRHLGTPVATMQQKSGGAYFPNPVSALSHFKV